MAQKGPKSLRRKMINSISLAVALLTAVMGGICYSLSRGAALSQGEKTLLAGAALQAQTAAKQFEWQKNWLSDLADKIASPEFSQSLMEEPDLLNQCLPEEKKEGDPVRLRGATQTFPFILGVGNVQARRNTRSHFRKYGIRRACRLRHGCRRKKGMASGL